MRKYYLDNIRYFTIINVVLFHVIYMYNGQSIPGVIGPFYKGQIQDLFQYIVYPWIMVLLFIISGMSSKYYLNKYDKSSYIHDRTVKLLVPSTIGLLVFGWAQGYYNMLLSEVFLKIPSNMNKLLLFLIMCISGTGVLWFNHVLWINSLILFLIIKFEKNKILNFCENINFMILLSLGFGLYFSAQILNTPIIVAYRFGIYGFAFLLGYFVFSHEKNIKHLEYNYKFLICMSITLGILFSYKYYGENYASKEIFGSSLSVSYSWFTCLSILGIGKLFFDKEYKFTKYMKEKSYGIYIFHYLFLSSTAYYLKKYCNAFPLIHYLLVGCSSFIGSILLFEIISKIPFINWCILGISNNKNKNKKNI